MIHSADDATLTKLFSGLTSWESVLMLLLESGGLSRGGARSLRVGMDRTRRSIFGHGELDRYSLAEVAVLKIHAGLECRKCRKFAAIDVDTFTRRNGCQFTLGEVRKLARCRRCGSKLPQILVRSEAMRGDRAWFPRAPGATR